ncbi:MAG: DUF45 domain-containing protein [Saprospirales bacterium]|nr:MAG: DUF45 domain-containing protein [Saprospirales bacterium]
MSHFSLRKYWKSEVIETDKEFTKLTKGFFWVGVFNKENNSRVKVLLLAWYKTHAEKRFNKSLQENLVYFKKWKINQPPLVIKRMSKRWGSCTSKGKIILNPELIKAPSRCIDYVVIHELCHLVHHNHNKEFYTLLQAIMPDWQKWKFKLEKLMC